VRGPGRCCNLVKICWHVFLRSASGKFCLETSPLSRNSGLSEGMRPGREEVLWTSVNNISPANHIDCISLVYSNIMHCGAGLRTTVTLIISQFKRLPRLTWGKKCSKIPYVQVLYYDSTKWVTHLIEQTCSTDYHTVFRCAEEGQISGFDPLPYKIRGWSARKKAQILKMSTSRRRYVQIPGNSVSVSLR